jgi:hypothetical protein
MMEDNSPPCQIIASRQKIFMIGKTEDLIPLAHAIIRILALKVGRSPQFVLENMLKSEKEEAVAHTRVTDIINLRQKIEERLARV